MMVIVIREEYCGHPDKVIHGFPGKVEAQVLKHYPDAVFSRGGFDTADASYVLDVAHVED